MEIRFTVDDNYIKDLQNKAGKIKATLIASEALSLFNWALDEVAKGKKIVALDEQKEKYKEVITPILDKVRKGHLTEA